MKPIAQSHVTDRPAELLSTVARAAVLAALTVVLATALPAAISAATITVNGNGDGASDDGFCTLREAITAVDTNAPSGASPGECPAGDASPTVDGIAFDLPAGSTTIVLASLLPSLIEPVSIDGYSQPGASPNTLPVGSDAVLVVELDGGALAAFEDCLNFDFGSDGSSIRGLAIHGCGGSAILIEGADTITVAGNYLGLDAGGAAAADTGKGVEIVQLVSSADDSVIGGPAPADRNVISANLSANLTITGSGHSIVNNYIGTDASGAVALGSSSGLQLFSGSNVVIEANVASGHGVFGILIGGASTDVSVIGNLVGTDATGALPLPNGAGVQVVETLDGAPTGIRIGSTTPGEGNRISYNANDGVVIRSIVSPSPIFPQAVRVSGNEIFENGDLGIDLEGDGPTPNDPLDADDGSNDLQNWPEITSLSDDGALLTADWSLESTPTTDFSIELFWSGACDPSGFGEGESFLGEAATTTDAAGMASGTFIVPSPGPGGISATATDTTGLMRAATSELSPCVVLSGPETPAIPTLDPIGLILLCAILAALGIVAARRSA